MRPTLNGTALLTSTEASPQPDRINVSFADLTNRLNTGQISREEFRAKAKELVEKHHPTLNPHRIVGFLMTPERER